jgi:hypothetical protein
MRVLVAIWIVMILKCKPELWEIGRDNVISGLTCALALSMPVARCIPGEEQRQNYAEDSAILDYNSVPNVAVLCHRCGDHKTRNKHTTIY